MGSISEGEPYSHRSEASVQLELREMLAVIMVLVDRAGGDVEITGEELEAARSGGWEVASIPSMLKYSLGLKLRKPNPEPEIEMPAQPAIGA